MNKLENSIIQKESKLIFKIAQHNAVKKNENSIQFNN